MGEGTFSLSRWPNRGWWVTTFEDELVQTPGSSAAVGAAAPDPDDVSHPGLPDVRAGRGG